MYTYPAYKRSDKIKEVSNIVYEEVLSGVYVVLKDENEKLGNEFDTASGVVHSLNYLSKVAVISNNYIHTNFAIEGV